LGKTAEQQSTADSLLETQVNIMMFLNVVINSTSDLDDRVALRNECLQLGLLPIVKVHYYCVDSWKEFRFGNILTLWLADFTGASNKEFKTTTGRYNF
jgi:hypothetical protein